jgi:large subunit ribosomal protein L6e
MAKSAAELLAKRKEARKKYLEENKNLKLKKNWYPTTNLKQHFKRKSKLPKPTHIQHALQPGQIVILLSGRFRGKRVVYLKKLDSGLLLVTGPYKYNGVPLKRVNQAYVLPTSTKVNLADVAKDVTDELFKRVEIKRESEKDFFEEPATKKGRITDDRKNAQVKVDSEVIKAVNAVPELNKYLKFRFALKNGDKPHLMKF